MKTAEEWIQIYNRLDNKNPRMNGWIQQIQLDAFKAGERFAADLIGSHKHQQNIDTMGALEFRSSFQQAILTDANNRTELP